MHCSIRTILFTLALSQHALSRALPRAEAGLCDGRACPDVAHVDAQETTTLGTLAARGTTDLEPWKIARAVIDPLPEVPHIDPEPEPVPEPAVPEPVDPLDPESPDAATAVTGPNNVLTAFTQATVKPEASTVPNEPSATDVASLVSTDAPPATAAPSPTGAPSATEAPSLTQDPSATEAPSPTGAPSPTQDPSVTEAPSPTGAPSPTQDPSATEAPSPSNAPSPTDAPSVTETPSPTGVPSATDDPQATGATAATDGVEATNIPAATDSADVPDILCSSNVPGRLARRCPAADVAKDEDSSGHDDEPSVPPGIGSTYSDIAAGIPNTALLQLQQRITNSVPDKVNPVFTNIYKQGQGPAQKLGDISTSDVTHNVSPNLLNAFGDPDVSISLDTQIIRTTITSNAGELPKHTWRDGEPTPEICDAAFSTDGKVLIAINSQKDNDLALASNKNKLFWSDFIFQQMQGFAGTSNNLKNLQWAVRNKVSNPQTLQTIQQAYQTLNVVSDQKLVLRSSDTDQNLQTAFDAVSRTVNVKGVNWMLADFHNALGNKQLQTIVIIPNGDVPTLEDGLVLPGVDMFLNVA